MGAVWLLELFHVKQFRFFYGKENDTKDFCFKENFRAAFRKISRKLWEKFRETSREKALFSGITEQNMVN